MGKARDAKIERSEQIGPDQNARQQFPQDRRHIDFLCQLAAETGGKNDQTELNGQKCDLTADGQFFRHYMLSFGLKLDFLKR
ncbi:hypothetical protein SDC9_106512 [bioreactor metagenome]|uniref:Uncharacterized protein n=1 Tax=bioreactor metagenome TaxID=1076179 RepID=A0A645B3L5_9ZZZZ